MDDTDPLLLRLRSAQQDVELATQHLEDAVGAARTAGATWQQIGSVLGVSKQAASQKYQNQATATPQALDHIQRELNARAEELFAAVSRSDIEAAHDLMTYATARLLSKRKILKTWQAVTDAVGEHLKIQRTVIEQSGSQNVLTYRLKHQHGEPVGQITFNSRTKITGWVIYLDDSAELPW
ncbi:hypothetical protein VVR12_09175 [Rothia sp. LK2588]|uniref:DUF3887 domain-containing protein n=1 Tax=Rothia sp. LK2588 TaxID=3114369 RepID=UPI0034CFD76C